MANDIQNTKRCEAIAEEIDELGVFAFIEERNIFDIETRIDSQGNYLSVRIMIACGGPNIYIDTKHQEVQLYWGGDEASCYLNTMVCNQIDEYFEELYQCMRCA